MMNVFFYILFLVFTVFIIIRCIAYGLYEINQNQNKKGGIAFIVFSVCVVLFSNIAILFSGYN